MMESIENSIKSICRRVKKSLKLLHGVDCLKPSDGGLNESGFKALFQSALSDDGYHVESEFRLGALYCDLMLTRRSAPFDVAIACDIKYCATPFIASRGYDNAHEDARTLDALKSLSVADICKLKMYWSKCYEPVSVKTVLLAAKKQTNAFAENLLATGMFPFVLSVTVVGIGPCLVTKIETLGRVRPMLVPSPTALFPIAHDDLTKLQDRMRQAMATLRSTDGDIDVRHGYKSGITLCGFKMLLLGALHDTSFFVGSAVNLKPRGRSNARGLGRELRAAACGHGERRHGRRKSRGRSHSRSPSSSRSRSSSSSSHRSRSHSRPSSRSSSRSRSSSASSDRSWSSSSSTHITRDGMSYTLPHEHLGTIHLLLFNQRTHPSHAVVVHFKYIPINDVHEYNAETKTFERFGDQRFDDDRERHKRRMYFSEGLKRMSQLSREEIEKVYVANPMASGGRSSSSTNAPPQVDTVGSVARAYSSLAFRQSQGVLEHFPSLTSCTSVSVIGVGSALLWLQEDVTPSPFSLESVKHQLQCVEAEEDMRMLAARFPRRRHQTDEEWRRELKEIARKREKKRRERMRHTRARSVEVVRTSSNRRRHGSSAEELLHQAAADGHSDLIAALAERYEQRQQRQVFSPARSDKRGYRNGYEYGNERSRARSQERYRDGSRHRFNTTSFF